MAVKLRASKVQPLAATTPTYLDYEGLVELVSKLKATYATQLSLDDYLTISAAASTYQPVGDYATNDTIYSLKSTILKQWEVHCEDGEMLSYNDSSKQLVLTSKAFGSDVDDDWGSRLSSSYTSNVYVRTICGEHIFGSTTDIDVASLIGLSSYALKTDIPTNVSAFTNDAGYITAADVVEPDLSGYVTTSSLTTTLADYAKTSDLPTLSSLSGIGTVNASGTSPLTLSASKSGTTVEITGSVDLSAYATTATLSSDYYTKTQVDSLLEDATGGGVTTVNASGTSPLTLSASKSGTTVEITGSVDLSAYATTSDLSSYVTSSSLTSTLADYAKTSDIPTLSSLGGIGTVTASGTSPLTLSASKSGTDVTISGSVDLSNYATQSWVQEQIADAVTGGTVDLSAYLTKSEAASTYQPIGNYTTSSDFKTINGNSIIGSGDITISGGGDVDLSGYLTKSEASSTYQPIGNYALASDIPTLSSLGGIDTVTASGSGNLSLSASKSGTTVAISGSVDLSDYATQAWVQEQITDAVTGGTVDLSAYLTKSEAASTYQPIGDYATNSYVDSLLDACVQLSDYEDYKEAVKMAFNEAGQAALSTSGDTTLQLITSYPTDVDLSDYTGRTTSVTFKTINGNSLFGSGDITIEGGGDVDLSEYSTTTEIQEVLLWLAEHDGLSQQTDGVTLRLTRYYPRVFGASYTGINSDVAFKTVAGESIFGSGDVALDDFADKASIISMANSIYRSSAMISTNNSNTAINFYGWEPSGDWLTGSLSNTTTINFKTVNGYPVIGSGDITIDSPGTATADELGLVRPWYDTNLGNNAENMLDRQINEQSTTTGRYYGISAVNGRLYVNVPWEGSDVDLSDYATQAWVQEYVVDVVTKGTVDLTAYATKSDVISLAKNQYSCFWATRNASSSTTTIGFDFWQPDGTSITDGDENQRYALYFANINGNSIVGTSSSQVSNLTISDLGGVSTSDLADYADKSGVMWLMELMARESELAYVKEDQRLKLELFYPDAWGETNMDESRETNVYVRTINGQHIFGDTSDIDVLPSDMTSLLSMQAQYPSATLLGMKETWFNTSLDNFNWVNAKIMDYDNETGSCRIRFGISDYGSSQTFAVRLIAAYSNEMQGSDNYYTALTSTTSGDCMAYFDLVVQYDEKTGSFPETYRKYYIEVDA